MTGDTITNGGNIFVTISIVMLVTAVICIIKARLISKKESVEKLCQEAEKVCEAINNGNKNALRFAQEQREDENSPYHYLISLEEDGNGWYVARLTKEAGYVSRRMPLMGTLQQDAAPR